MCCLALVHRPAGGAFVVRWLQADRSSAAALTAAPSTESCLNLVTPNLVVPLKTLLALVFPQNTRGLYAALEPGTTLFENFRRRAE